MPFADDDHPLVKEMRDQWPKILAILMLKTGMHDVEITKSDIEVLGDDRGVIADSRGGRFFVRLRTLDEIREMQAAERASRK